MVASGTARSGMAWLCDCSRRHHGRRVSSIAARTTAVRAYASGFSMRFHFTYSFDGAARTASSATCQSPHVR